MAECTPSPTPFVRGPQGPSGTKGSAGPQGPPGTEGDRGPRGQQGDIGLQGPAGAGGGAQGAQGDPGGTGSQGSQGAQGPAGSGAQGAQGPQGEPGEAGGTGGESIVPAHQVVGSDRSDWPLTRAGLISAISSLPSTGGDIHIGTGALTIDLTLGPITIDRDVRLFGAGIGNTVITCTGAGTLFSVGDFYVTMEDIQFMGDTGVSDQVFFDATALSGKPFFLKNVGIGTSYANAVGAFRVIFSLSTFERTISATDCFFNVFCSTHTLEFFIRNSPQGAVFRFENVNAATGAQIEGFPQIYAVNTQIIEIFAQPVEIGYSGYLSGSAIMSGGGPVTIRGSLISNSAITGDTITIGYFGVGTFVTATGCNFTGSIIADNDNIKLSNCKIVGDFTSTTYGSNTIQCCSFNDAASGTYNIFLTDSSNNIISDNINAQVLESGTSDNNNYDNNTGFGQSTLIGPASIVDGLNVRNVRTWGAVGDGVTDDTAAIQVAIDNLPPTGGVLYFPPGTYFVSSGFIINKPLSVMGAGRNATNILLDTDAKLFYIGDTYTSFEDFTVLGDQTSDQSFITFTSTASDFFAHCNITRVNINTSPFGVTTNGIRTAIDFDGFFRRVNITDSYFGVRDTGTNISWLFKDTTSSSVLTITNFWSTIGAGITGSPIMLCDHVTIASNASTEQIAIGASSHFFEANIVNIVSISAGCRFIDSSIQGTFTIGSSLTFIGGSLPPTTLSGGSHRIIGAQCGSFEIDGVGDSIVEGCFFGGNTLTLTDASQCIIKNNHNIIVVEAGTSDNNTITDINSTSTIIGEGTKVNNSEIFYATGQTTTSSLVEQFTYTNPKGLFGIGTIINTGLYTLVVEETVEDAFGNSAVVSTEVPIGEDIQLDLQIKFGNGDTEGVAFPPIISYTVSISDQGNATTFDARFAVRGAM